MAGTEEHRLYWLHITEATSPARGMPSTYVLTRADPPGPRGSPIGKLPSFHFATWSELARKLAACGIQAPELESAKAQLDSDGSCVLPSVMLSDSELRTLGFEETY